MRPREKSNRGKKSAPLFYAAFFLFLPICAAAYLAASVRLWHDWQRNGAAYQMPPVMVDTVENAVPARPPVPAVEEVPAIEIMEPEEKTKPENAAPVTIGFDALRVNHEDITGGELWGTPNTVIYRPLNTLIGYTSQDYYEEHPEIWLLTPDGDYCIHLLGGREIPSDSPFFHPDSQPEAEKEMLHVMEKSTFIAPAQIRGRLVTLCANMDETGESRFVVFGLTK